MASGEMIQSVQQPLPMDGGGGSWVGGRVGAGKGNPALSKKKKNHFCSVSEKRLLRQGSLSGENRISVRNEALSRQLASSREFLKENQSIGTLILKLGETSPHVGKVRQD